MTREETIKDLQRSIDLGLCPSKESRKMAIQALEKESCEDVAKERYEDLCEYFGGAKDILKHREDFKAWLSRVKWHIHKAEELSAENDDLRDQLAMRDRLQKQEPILEIKTVTNVEEAEAYPISENITKGFEEFTKMMFKQGRAESEEV